MQVGSDVQRHMQIMQACGLFNFNIQGHESDYLMLCKNLVVENEAAV